VSSLGLLVEAEATATRRANRDSRGPSMSIAPGHRILVYATLRAQKSAERLMPGKILENEVERQIVAGNLTG
jgi:Mg-chelatase subunit ChlD